MSKGDALPSSTTVHRESAGGGAGFIEKTVRAVIVE
jgi:hypothetical protein